MAGARGAEGVGDGGKQIYQFNPLGYSPRSLLDILPKFFLLSCMIYLKIT
jgi:hypothetical protein